MSRNPLRCAFALGFASSLAGSLQAATVYQNNSTDTLLVYVYSAVGATGLGDQISLTGTERLATSASTQFFNVLTTPGTFDATLSLYTVGGVPDTLGSLLGSSTVQNISIPGFDLLDPLAPGTVTVTFSGLNVVVPDTLIFILSVANVSGADPGVTVFEPPTAGTSDNAQFFTDTSGSATSAGEGNLNFQLDAIAVPEVGGVHAIVTVAFVSLAAASLRRRRLAQDPRE